MCLNTFEIGYDKWYIRKLQEKGRKAAGKRHFPATQLFQCCLQEPTPIECTVYFGRKSKTDRSRPQESVRKVAGKRHFPATQLFQCCLQEPTPIECTIYFGRNARQTAAGCRKVAGKRQESGRKAPLSCNAGFSMLLAGTYPDLAYDLLAYD